MLPAILSFVPSLWLINYLKTVIAGVILKMGKIRQSRGTSQIIALFSVCAVVCIQM